MLYWSIGRQILDVASSRPWTLKLTGMLARDLGKAFPGAKQWTVRNLKFMCIFVDSWPQNAIADSLITQVTWQHHMLLMVKVKNQAIREWYLLQTIDNRWSSNALSDRIAGNLHRKTIEQQNPDRGRRSLPKTVDQVPSSRTYFRVKHQQRQRLRDSLIKLGSGLAFVGSQLRLRSEEQTCLVDLLFYHVRLHRFLVVALRVDPITSECRSRLTTCIAVADKVLRTEKDDSTLGLIACSHPDGPTIEYVLPKTRSGARPTAYQFGRELSGPLREELPSSEDLGYVLETLGTQEDSGETPRRPPSPFGSPHPQHPRTGR